MMTSESPKEIEGAVVVVDPQEQAIVRAASGDVVEAFSEYRKIQKALDDAMPDCMIPIQGKNFRKKNYWRAIATAFNLTVTIVREERIEAGDDWGWLVVYNAAAKNGRSADGDGSCFASEKSGASATVHNVRSHAHTRAYNRAVSNIVGFGEVSAEEMPYESPSTPPADRTITAKQRERLYAKGNAAAKRLNVPAEQIDDFAKRRIRDLGLASSKDLTKEPYENICAILDNMTLTDLATPDSPTPDQEWPF
jgi:hypothetical protein